MSDQKSEMQHALAAGAAIAKPQSVEGDEGTFIVVPEGYKVEDLGRFLSAPIRARGTVKCETVEALIAYYNRFCDEAASLVFACCETFQVVGVLDWHKPTLEAGFAEHRVIYEAPRSDEWEIWTKSNGITMSQFDFALFIENNVKDIRKPAGAEMLEIARTLEATKKVDFVSGIRLSDGQREFTYNEEVQGTTRKGQMKVPETFLVGIPVFVAGEHYAVTARLRYRIESGDLRLWYDLLNPHEIERDAVGAIVDKVDKAVKTDVLMARAPSA